MWIQPEVQMAMEKFRVLISVTTNHSEKLVLWSKVSMVLDGDKNNLKHLKRELEIVKQEVNNMVNREGFRLKDVDIKIEFD